ncbi:MAG: prepilin-type N-terminal cleavage/methylation domain-containing protein [Candidatus Omnitrophica bacterium]|nr:prepilin-type N-terminal cleavage/methylation domain-containing protein [Candidatus Omnitrophota bacterium]
MITNERKNNNRAGYSLLELMVVIAILMMLMSALFRLLGRGSEVWTLSDTKIDLQSNLRSLRDRIAGELEQSGSDGTNMKVFISQGTGVNSSDVLKFSIPVVCQSGGSIMNSTADVAYWGAPLTYGCTDYTCMDHDNNCATIDYTWLVYQLKLNTDLTQLNKNNPVQQYQLVRQVLGADGTTVVREDVMGANVPGFKASFDTASNALITLTLTASGISNFRRTVLPMTTTFEVNLRNKR